MERDNRFAGLKNSAVRVAKFVQGKHMDALNPAVQAPGARPAFNQDQFERLNGGVCASLTTKWLQEKLGAVRYSVLKKRDFVRNPSRDHVNRVMRSAAHMQLAHHASGRTNLPVMLAQNGIHADRILDVRNEKIAPTPDDLRDHPESAKAATHQAHLSIDLTFAQVCANLKRGQGVVMRMSVKDMTPRDTKAKPEHLVTDPIDAHATGLYRSRLGKVYFFDPNCGVYKVNDPAEFIKAWKEAYAQRDQILTMGNVNDGFFTCTSMKND